MDLIQQVEGVVQEVRLAFAPDVRLAVYEVAAVEDGDTLVLVGATSDPAAAEELHRRVALLDAGRPIRDEIVRLPFLPQGGSAHALVAASVAPILSGPLVSEAHLSQAVLGHRMMVLRERERWLQCRSPDGYIGWVHRGYLHRVDDLEARRWEMGHEGEVCHSLGAKVLGEDGEVLALLPWGSRVVRLDGSTARLPNGLTGRVEGEIFPVSEQELRFPPVGEAVVETASRWIGTPYLWGGITRSGADCSGFVQAVFRTHGVELPRDSDQQAKAGDGVDPGGDFSALVPGDLLFFAEDATRVSHVTLSLGGSRIIHASLGNGGVRRNDLMGDLAYEEELRRLFVCARRMIPNGAAAPTP